MKIKTTRNILLSAMLLGASAFTAQAQVTIFSDNLDSLSGTAPGYSYGDAQNVSYNYISGAGVGGSVGMVLAGDIPSGANGYGGFAIQYQDGTATGNTSANLSDYTLSFDANINDAGGGFEVIFESFPGAGVSGTMTGEAITTELPSTANEFVHYSINLGSMTLDPYGASTLPIMNTAASFQVGWQLQTGLGNVNEPVSGLQLVIDNPMLTMVPEPASLAFCVLGGLGMFGFLSRRKV